MAEFDFITIDRDLHDNACPYCGVVFESALRRSQKCKECKEYIERVRFPGRIILLTMFEADKFYDFERRRLNEEMRPLQQERFREKREQAIRLGFRKYQWLAIKDGRACPESLQNDGEEFSWETEIPHPNCNSIQCLCFPYPTSHEWMNNKPKKENN